MNPKAGSTNLKTLIYLLENGGEVHFSENMKHTSMDKFVDPFLASKMTRKWIFYNFNSDQILLR